MHQPVDFTSVSLLSRRELNSISLKGINIVAKLGRQLLICASFVCDIVGVAYRTVQCAYRRSRHGAIQYSAAQLMRSVTEDNDRCDRSKFDDCISLQTTQADQLLCNEILSTWYLVMCKS